MCDHFLNAISFIAVSVSAGMMAEALALPEASD